MFMVMKIEPLSDALGAKVTNLNLEKEVADSDLILLNEAFLKYHLLCIEGNPLSSSKFAKFAAVFGEPQMQLLRHRWDKENPEVSILESTYKTPDSKPKDLNLVRLSGWHTDDSYFEKPAKATVLQALAIPSSGGQTRFSNTRKAFEEMPETVKSNITELIAVHSYDTIRANARAQKLTTEETNETKDVEHPLVRTHEDTNLKSIYFNPNRTDRIIGMGREESDNLLDVIYAWVTKEEFQYHHEWRLGDILLWDNRCLLHSVNVDYPIGETRKHQRVLLKGTRPV